MLPNDLASAFHQLHASNPLILANAWDAASARLIEMAGAKAIATTSAGLSWALGRRDGHGLCRKSAMNALRTIVDAVHLPVTADIESGYGEGTPEDVAETVAAVIDTGAVGINLEDSPGQNGEKLRTPSEQARRIEAARRAAESRGIQLFLNARTDVYLAQVGTPADRPAEVLHRAAVYLDAGADGIFVPGLSELTTITALAQEIDGPLNVMAGPGGPSVTELSRAGAQRISLGPAITLASMGFVQRAVSEVLTEGTFQALEGGLSFPEANGLFGNA